MERTIPRASRRKYLINSRLQIGILAYSIFLSLIVSALRSVFEKLLMAHMSGTETYWAPLLVTIASSSVIFTLALVYGLYLTNRIAGPIHRLTSHMEAVNAGGEVRQLQFRESDYFTEVLDPYNRMLRALKEHQSKGN